MVSVLIAFSSAYPAHNLDILKNECMERSRKDFAVMKKESKITVNGRLMGYYGFENSASAVILLDVSNTDVQLPKMNFSFTNLIMLHASNSGLEKIDDIGNETFPSLKFLNLSHNTISSVVSNVFSHLRELEVLDLSFNCFVHFNYDHVFLRHEHLKKIFLHDNLLHSVRGTAGLNHIMQLDMLDLKRNIIEEFNDFNLQVKHLELKSNALQSLEIHHAQSMTLDASENNLTSFIALGRFTRLDLSRNDFKFLSQVEIKEAKILNLSYNLIESCLESSVGDESDEETIFSNEDGNERDGILTEILDISHNNISSMKNLHLFKFCESISLEGNQLKNLDFEKIRQDFPRVKRMNLINNPLTDFDLTEIKFHNDTRFLNIHFDYATASESPETTLLPQLSIFFPTLSTTASNVDSRPLEVTTLQNEKIIEKKPAIEGVEEGKLSEITKDVDKFVFLWIFAAALFALLSISIVLVIFIIYNKHSRAVTPLRFMNREFNEAENPL